MAARLASAGAEVELFEPEPGALDRWDRQVPAGLGFAGRPQLLLASAAPARGRSLLLNGHIDVVSAEPRERWASDPFEPEVRDGRPLRARGVRHEGRGRGRWSSRRPHSPMPGSSFPGELTVSTVTDEEWNGAGALALAARGIDADAGIVPEATGFEPWIAAARRAQSDGDR